MEGWCNLEIGAKVKIIVGTNKGIIGTYKGIQNNANWHIVDLGESAGIMYVNPEEIEEVKEPVAEFLGFEAGPLVEVKDETVFVGPADPKPKITVEKKNKKRSV